MLNFCFGLEFYKSVKRPFWCTVRWEIIRDMSSLPVFIRAASVKIIHEILTAADKKLKLPIIYDIIEKI